MKRLLIPLILLLTAGCTETKHYVHFALVQEGWAWKGAQYTQDMDTWYEMASKDFWFYAKNGKVLEGNIPKSHLKKKGNGIIKIDTSFLKVTKPHDDLYFDDKYVDKVGFKYQLVTFDETYEIDKSEYRKLYKAKKNDKVITLEVIGDSLTKIKY